MPRVKTRTKSSAGKEVKCGKCGAVIKPGETYYTWAFRYGGKRANCHLHPPKMSELTQSKMGTVYAAQEDAEDSIGTAENAEEVKDAVAMVADVVQEVIDEYRQAAENFGEQGPSAEAADELEGWQSELEAWEPNEDEELDDIRNEAKDVVAQCPR